MFIGDESGLQAAGTVTLGHFVFLVREGKCDTGLEGEGAPGLVVKAVECSLEKWFSFLPSFLPLLLCFCPMLPILCWMNHGNRSP